MRIFFRLTGILFLFLLIVGCSDIQTSRPSTSKTTSNASQPKEAATTDENTVVFNMGKTTQLSRLLEFINHTKTGQTDNVKIQVITANKTANKNLQYDGNQITYKNEKGKTLVCKNIDISEQASNAVYEVNGCEGEINSEWVFQSSVSALKEAEKEHSSTVKN
ncbi:hypothetical protein AWW70_26770 [Bacillus mycoides]|uniref:DUF4362 domain-containing protein n=1 Tax=Bacillus mycoides TaxID=1405 RepID=A0A109FTR2_BACMY|nr:hypothetical protein [Bacillus mycoides]KWU54398.1 hypothetical protein AWW70_26770 [Bacillus mycoides]